MCFYWIIYLNGLMIGFIGDQFSSRMFCQVFLHLMLDLTNAERSLLASQGPKLASPRTIVVTTEVATRDLIGILAIHL